MKRIWHVVMQHNTLTFLTEEDAKDWMGPRGHHAPVLCSSELTDAEWEKVKRWSEFGMETSNLKDTQREMGRKLLGPDFGKKGGRRKGR